MPHRNGSGIALLADPTRRDLVAAIAERPRSPSALARQLGLSRSATSHQVRLLEDAGLIVRRQSLVDRRRVLLHVHPKQVGPIIAWLAGTGVGGR